MSFGEYSDGRRWEDGRRLGFVSAGGGAWYSRSLRNLPIGARINVHIPGLGYVAVGETLAEARVFDKALVQRDGVWVSLREQQVMGHYRESGQDDPEGLEAEWVVPVRWAVANPATEAYWERVCSRTRTAPANCGRSSP